MGRVRYCRSSACAGCSFPQRLGIGSAMRAGLRYAVRLGYDVVVRLDGDGQHASATSTVCSRRLGGRRRRRARLALCRRPRGSAPTPILKRALGILPVEAHRPPRDRSDVRDSARSAARAIALLAEHHPTGYPEPELRLFLSRNQLAVVEVPVSDRPRLGGTTSLTAGRADRRRRARAARDDRRPVARPGGRPAVTDRVQVVALAVSVLLLLVVLELVRRRKLTEEYSFLWILCALALVLLSVRRDILDAAARWLGVYYPPAVLLMLLILMVFVASLCFSVIVSRQRQQIERLIEETAILAAEIREAAPRRPAVARDRIGGGAGPGPRRGAARRVTYSHAGLVWTLVRTDFKARYHGDDRRLRVGAAQAAGDVPRADGGVLVHLRPDPDLQAEPDHRAVPVGLLRRGHQDRAHVAARQGLPAHQGALSVAGSWS